MHCLTCYISMQTLSNLRRNGCLGGIPVVVLLGVGSVIGAGIASWRDVRELSAQRHERLSADEDPRPTETAQH